MQAGTQLAHYEILSPLGKGGMGEVWRARDIKLGREVAIKTLPEEFAGDADRLARFEREAKLLASLKHPNIAAIYGLEEDNGTRFLVIELVEGDTLAERRRNIRRQPVSAGIGGDRNPRGAELVRRAEGTGAGAVTSPPVSPKSHFQSPQTFSKSATATGHETKRFLSLAFQECAKNLRVVRASRPGFGPLFLRFNPTICARDRPCWQNAVSCR